MGRLRSRLWPAAGRAEADCARAILLTLAGWTSGRIAEAFSVRQDTVRLWRSDFIRGGVEALKARVAPGPEPLKAQAALRVAEPLLSAPVADRPNWILARLAEEIASPRRRDDLKIAAVGKLCAKKGVRPSPSAPHPERASGQRRRRPRRPCGSNCARRKAEAGDIVLPVR
jgi:transposase